MEDAECQYGYAFLIRFDRSGVILDSMCDVSPMVGKTHEGYQAKRALLQGRPDLLTEEDKAMHFIAQQLHFMELRSRFIGGSEDPGPFLFKSPVPLTFEQLSAVVKHMPPERLQEAKL